MKEWKAMFIKKAKDFRVLDNINGEYYNSFEMPSKEWNAQFYT